MQAQVTNEFKEICRQILAENRNEDAWGRIESDDMFQTKHYIGGLNATETAFCFSHFDTSCSEFWFQSMLAQVIEVVAGRASELEAVPVSH